MHACIAQQTKLTARPTKACNEPQSTKNPAPITELTTPSIYCFISPVPSFVYVVYTHHLALVWPPNNGFVVNGIFCGSGPWDNLPIGDVERVQDADYGEFASAGALLFC